MDQTGTPIHSDGGLKPTTYGIFLGDLSLFCNEDDISTTFSQFGQLADVRIKRNKTTKRNLSYGFVEYLSLENAVAAMNEMNGKVFCGRALKIRWATTVDAPKVTKSRAEIGKVEDTKSVSIYLAFNSTVPNLMINDESLRVLFGSFGPIEDVSIKQSVIDRQTLCQRGYAFVCFLANDAGIQAAVAASMQMGNCLVDGVHYRCEVSKSLRGIIDPKSVPQQSNFGEYGCLNNFNTHNPPQNSNNLSGYLPYQQARPPQGVAVHSIPYQQARDPFQSTNAIEPRLLPAPNPLVLPPTTQRSYYMTSNPSMLPPPPSHPTVSSASFAVSPSVYWQSSPSFPSSSISTSNASTGNATPTLSTGMMSTMDIGGMPPSFTSGPPNFNATYSYGPSMSNNTSNNPVSSYSVASPQLASFPPPGPASKYTHFESNPQSRPGFSQLQMPNDAHSYNNKNFPSARGGGANAHMSPTFF